LRIYIYREFRKIILRSAVLFAGLAIAVAFAIAEPCDYNPANLAFDSINSGGTYQYADYYLNMGNCGPADFGHDNIDWGALDGNGEKSDSISRNTSGDDSSIQLNAKVRSSKRPDFNRGIFFRNKLEYSQDVGWLPINVPFPFDFLLSDQYELYPLKYTLVPIIGSLRWQLGNIRGPLILRGNWDLEFSGAVVAIPRGAETRYFAYMMGMRRNFVPRNWRATPYFDWRTGLGDINAKGPLGVPYAQGQNFTFTLNMGSGVRYNFNSRYAISAGLNWMHISNANLSEHKYDPSQPYPYGFINYGINVYGPMFGFDIQLRGHPRQSE
jgi:hypothetical protein